MENILMDPPIEAVEYIEVKDDQREPECGPALEEIPAAGEEQYLDDNPPSFADIKGAPKWQIYRNHDESEIQDLKDSIRDCGVIGSIKVDEDGYILSGYAIRRAVTELREEGITVPDPKIALIRLENENTKLEYAITTNVIWRKLTRHDKRLLVGRYLRIRPGTSDREIGRFFDVDGKTVADVRANLSDKYPEVMTDKRVGKDGVAQNIVSKRSSSSKKKRPRPNLESEPITLAVSSPCEVPVERQEIFEACKEYLEEHIWDIEQELAELSSITEHIEDKDIQTCIERIREKINITGQLRGIICDDSL